jgi:Integrase core domain
MMSQTGKREVLAEIRPRYTLGTRTAKRRILDELVAITGYHRKYAIQLLNHPPKGRTHKRRVGQPKYDGRVRAALEKVWRAANCICGKRLVPALAEFVDALERHGELKLDAETRRLLLRLSPATADRLLKRARQGVRPHGLGTTKPGALLKQAIPIRTFAQWDDARPGFMEIDLVAHCGTSTHGEYLNSLNMIDVKTRWVELAPLINRSQATVTAAVADCQTRLPYRLLGVDSDNGSEFINGNLRRHCEKERITFTRCRPYKKNDQAYVEQKNWTAVRQVVGYDRYEGQAAWAALNALYIPLRLYLNFFQPVMVLVEKQRNGAKVKKRYDKAKTPYQRVLDAPEVADDAKQRLRQLYSSLNPAELLRQVQVRQTALWKLAQQPADANMSTGTASALGGEPGFPAPLLLPVAADNGRNLNEMVQRQSRKVRSRHEATIPSG